MNDVTIIGWNDRIESLHIKDVRNEFLLFHDQDKPRNGNILENNERTKKKYTQGLRSCKKIELHNKRKKCTNLYSMCGNKLLFWK